MELRLTTRKGEPKVGSIHLAPVIKAVVYSLEPNPGVLLILVRRSEHE